MSRRGETIRLATRGSDLALRQAGQVKEALESRRHEVELIEVETRGDRLDDELIHRLGKTGAFVRSLDQKVLDGEADAAVHSMKDVPTEQPEDLVIAAVPERASVGDLLVTPDGQPLEGLPKGATVGTSSLRRGAQLLRARPDLEIEPLRGNVDTRVEKLLGPSLQREHERRLEAEEQAADEEGDADEEEDAGEEDDPEFDQSAEEWFSGLAEIERRAMGREVETEYDAIVLAAAGLERSGLRRRVPTSELPVEEFAPAAGQGALAVTTQDSDLAETVQSALDDPVARVTTTTERALLAELGGGCVAPIGIHAQVQGEYVYVTVQVHSRDGTEVIETTRDLPVERHAAAARELGRKLRDQGAAELVEAARREADEETEAKREDA